MAQLVTRIDDDLARAIDDLVAAGEVASRSDAVRVALRRLVDDRRRRDVGRAILEGYERVPLTAEEIGWSNQLTDRMIAEERW